jgi:hypothetical protein
MEYRWVIDQFEYSTDVLFRSRQHLAELYPRLLDHAAVRFSAQDILTFLDRKLHGNFQAGELPRSAAALRAPASNSTTTASPPPPKLHSTHARTARACHGLRI